MQLILLHKFLRWYDATIATNKVNIIGCAGWFVPMGHKCCVSYDCAFT